MIDVLAYLLAGFLLVCVLALVASFRGVNRPLSGRVAEAHANADSLAVWVAGLNDAKEQGR